MRTKNFDTEKDFLRAYNIHDYDIPLSSVDMAIFTLREDALAVLLVRRAQFPKKGRWALPGGFIDVQHDKDLDHTAQRKLYEKTGIKTAYLEQVVTRGDKRRDPRGWSLSVAYNALIDSSQIQLSVNEASEAAAWVPVEEALKDYKLAFDHDEILQQCLERLRAKVQYTSLPIHLLPGDFTLSELQQVFEIVLDKSVEKKAFRRRILDAQILEETGAARITGKRPAKLYRVATAHRAHFFPRAISGKT